MKQIFFYSCLISMVCTPFVSLLIAETPPCTKEELMLFFPQTIVKDILTKNGHLAEKDAEEISKELAVKDRNLNQLVDEKAAKYDPNPFKDQNQRDQAIKIYQETLFEVFASVLKAHGIKDEKQIRTLLDEVRSVKSRLFIDCIRKEQLPTQNK